MKFIVAVLTTLAFVSVSSYSQFDITNTVRGKAKVKAAPVIDSLNITRIVLGDLLKDKAVDATKINAALDALPSSISTHAASMKKDATDTTSKLDALTGFFTPLSSLSVQPTINLKAPVTSLSNGFAAGGYLRSGLPVGDTTGEISTLANLKRILQQPLHTIELGLSLQVDLIQAFNLSKQEDPSKRFSAGFVGTFTMGSVQIGYSELSNPTDTNSKVRKSIQTGVGTFDLSGQIGYGETGALYGGVRYMGLASGNLPGIFHGNHEFTNAYAGICVNVTTSSDTKISIKSECIFITGKQGGAFKLDQDYFVTSVQLNASHTFSF